MKEKKIFVWLKRRALVGLEPQWILKLDFRSSRWRQCFPSHRRKTGFVENVCFIVKRVTKAKLQPNMSPQPISVFQLFSETALTNTEIMHETQIFYNLFARMLIIMGCSLPIPVLDFCSSRRSTAPPSCRQVMTAATRYAA